MRGAAQFAWEKGEPAGRGSDTLPTARWLFLPLIAGDRRLGVLGIAYEDDRQLARTDRRLLDALIDQIALALERLRLTEDLAATQLASETERLRTALLNSVSHDLRTPLVTIIGAAEHLVESELFGYEKGAFSGADSAKPGMFELADKGTIFLDEIGELDPRIQVKLLRVLDGAPYFRLGGSRKILTDVRIIAATNQPLD